MTPWQQHFPQSTGADRVYPLPRGTTIMLAIRKARGRHDPEVMWKYDAGAPKPEHDGRMGWEYPDAVKVTRQYLEDTGQWPCA